MTMFVGPRGLTYLKAFVQPYLTVAYNATLVGIVHEWLVCRYMVIKHHIKLRMSQKLKHSLF